METSLIRTHMVTFDPNYLAGILKVTDRSTAEYCTRRCSLCLEILLVADAGEGTEALEQRRIPLVGGRKTQVRPHAYQIPAETSLASHPL